MALSGMHVVCRYVGSLNGNPGTKMPMPIWGPAVWSETLAAAATTTNVVPAKPDPQYGDAAVTLRASADSYVSYGPAPADPALSATTREFVPAGEFVDLFVPAGSKIRCALA
jgi:hypothetical protein